LKLLGSYTHPSSSSGIETADDVAAIQAELRKIYDSPSTLGEDQKSTLGKSPDP
jgi:hypothetical protein